MNLATAEAVSIKPWGTGSLATLQGQPISVGTEVS